MNNFSSLLEFVAAVYVSMYFDKIFDFWSISYKKELDKAIKQHSWTNDFIFGETLQSHTQKWYKEIHRRMLNRAAYMVFVVMLMLLYIGYESDHNIAIALTSLICLFFTFAPYVSQFVFSKFKTALLFVLVLLVAYIILIKYEGDIPTSVLKSFLEDEYKEIVLIACIFPAAYQLFLSWIYTEPYSKFLRKKMDSFGKLYADCQVALKTHNYDSLPDEFKNILTKTIVLNGTNECEDTSLKLYDIKLQNRLLDACKPQSFYVILVSWLCFQGKFIYENIVRIFNKNGEKPFEEKKLGEIEIPIEFQKAKTRLEDYTDEYKMFREERKKNYQLSLRAYCNNRNLHYNTFRKWLKTNPQK